MNHFVQQGLLLYAFSTQTDDVGLGVVFSKAVLLTHTLKGVCIGPGIALKFKSKVAKINFSQRIN